MEDSMNRILRAYYNYHLGIGELKSEQILI
jgi:hypothetical protein